MTKQIPFILILCSLAASCFDLFQSNDEYFNLNNYLERIADFKEGSYWIYYNDSMNINDTITLISYEKKQPYEPFDSHYQYFEKVYIALRSTYWNCIIKDMLISDRPGSNYERWYSENPITGKLGFNFDFIEDSELGSVYGNIKYLNDYSFNGKILNQVICFDTHGVERERYIPGCEYYFAQDYGLIKMKLMIDSISTEWNLIDFEIVK